MPCHPQDSRQASWAALRRAQVCALEQLQVAAEGVFHLAETDILVGGMGAGRLSGSQLERREGHQGLVAEGGGTKGLHAYVGAAADEGMGEGDVRRAQVEGACLGL